MLKSAKLDAILYHNSEATSRQLPGTSQPPLKKQEASSKVFFDVAADNQPLGRIEMVLYDDVVPKTTRNFKALAKGILQQYFPDVFLGEVI